MNKIRKVSQIFRIFFQIAFILIPCLVAISWLNAPYNMDWNWLAHASVTKQSGFAFSPMPANVKVLILHPLSAMTKFYGFLITLIPTAIQLAMLYFLIKLFKLYELGEIFSSKNVKCIRYIGYSMLIGQALNPVYEGLLSLAMTWHNPHGHRIAIISLSGANIAILITAFLIILISWIMAEGSKLHEEQTYTV